MKHKLFVNPGAITWDVASGALRDASVRIVVNFLHSPFPKAEMVLTFDAIY